MGRLNVSIPDDLAPLVSKWRRRINLSEICSDALRSELLGVESHRSARPLLAALRKPTQLEATLARRFELVDVHVVPERVPEDQLRPILGRAAADYLNQHLSEGSVLAVAGGRQSWCVVENMTPRNLGITIQALGFRQNDPLLLNAHANTLVTLLWLLFSPRGVARLVGSEPDEMFRGNAPLAPQPRYFVVGSCGPFGASCPLANLLDDQTTDTLLARGAIGDVLYTFFDTAGGSIGLPRTGDESVLTAAQLQTLSDRTDSRVVLVAGGSDKTELMQRALEAKLCNVLVTDTETARRLIST
jgi:DNA-binding transcriptional regulator LsrR (DeoR family)